jgi:hypothetical protein
LKQKQQRLQARNEAARRTLREEAASVAAGAVSQTKANPITWDEKTKAYYAKEQVKFAQHILHFNPLPYQVILLEDPSKRIVVIWPRQSGKTTTLSVRMIWYAATHDRTTSLIVAPGLRQSMIVMDRIHAFLMTMDKQLRRKIVAKMQRTVIWFKNGSQLVALPNSPNLLRGYTAHNVLTDESAFFRDDELVFYNVLFPMLQTTQGTLIASSTPWGKDSVFYKFTQEKVFSKRWVKIDELVKAGVPLLEFHKLIGGNSVLVQARARTLNRPSAEETEVATKIMEAVGVRDHIPRNFGYYHRKLRLLDIDSPVKRS